MGSNRGVFGLAVVIVVFSLMACPCWMLSAPAAAETIEVSVALDPLAFPRAGAGVVMAGEDAIYVFGGYQNNFTVFDVTSASALLHNLTTGTTTSLANMVRGVAWPSCVKLQDGRVAVIGGYDSSVSNGTTTVQIYNPATNTWTTNASAPLNIHRAGNCLGLDGKVYVFGPSNHQNSTMIYDPVADSWSFGHDLPSGRERYGSSAVAYSEDAIYVIGGHYFFYIEIMPGNWIPVLGDMNCVDLYDPGTDTWSSQPSLNYYKGSGGAVLTELGHICYMGGGAIWGGGSDKIERFDPADPGSGWTVSDHLLSGNKYHFGTALDDHGRVFLVGGCNATGGIVPDIDMLLVTEVSEVDEVSISCPGDGDEVSGTVDICVTLKNHYSSSPVVLDLYVDGSLLESQLGGGASSWTFKWNTSGLDVGSTHAVLVRAFFSDSSVSEDSASYVIGEADQDQALEERLASMEENITEVLSTVSELEERLSALGNSTDDLNSTVSEIYDDLVALTATVASLQSHLSDLEAALSSLDTATSSDLEALMAEVDALSMDLASIQEWADSVSASLDEIAAQPGLDLSEVLDMLDDLGASLGDLNETVEDISSSAEAAEDSSASARVMALVAAVVAAAALAALVLLDLRRKRSQP